ncbi:galactan 1-3-beta-galactosidase [Apiospora phragmitis]|uniref:Galactan 1-3-beta-galactosidase n=1 Tax=Apiospora phragmitis TaxID=2905665 RepID=A0ABR1WVF5_9PEZI
MKPLIFLSASIVFRTVWGASWVVPGAVWYDIAGKKIDAHGGAVVQRGSTWFWVGYSASDNQTPLMYQSTDLINWENLGKQAPSVTGMWRPKFASPNGSSFWDRDILSLSSSQYSYSDTGMFFDKATDAWYLLTSADHNTVQINKINSDGSIGSLASSLTKGAYEAPSILESDGIYFLLVSGKTGYRANANQAFWAPSLAGPNWTGPSDIAPPGREDVQLAEHARVRGGGQPVHDVYLHGRCVGRPGHRGFQLRLAARRGRRRGSEGHAAVPCHVEGRSGYGGGVVSGGAEACQRRRSGALVMVGTFALLLPPLPPPPTATIPNKEEPCMVHRLRTGDEVTFRNVTGLGGAPHEWVSVRYTVNDPDAGEAYIRVNDQAAPVNLSEYNSCAGYHDTVPVRLRLEEGDVNTITLGAIGTAGFEMEVEGLELHEDD